MHGPGIHISITGRAGLILPAHVTRATEAGWRQSFAALDALLAKGAVA